MLDQFSRRGKIRLEQAHLMNLLSPTNIFTVPTTCSRPSIEMIGFMYVCMYVFIYVFLRVHSPDQTVIYY